MDSHSVRNQWADRSGEFSPAYYAQYGADRTSELLRELLNRHLDADAAVLELGCSSGRHLAHLADHGFENLSGVDINAEAFDVMAEHFPALARDGTFYCGSIEDVVVDFDDGQFDAVYSVETLQHLHPDVDWVFEEVARITDRLLITVENEGPTDVEEGEDTGMDGEELTEGEDEASTDRRSSADAAVRYVDDGVPLYYRDWNRIFTALGFEEVETVRGRDVVRVFRAPG